MRLLKQRLPGWGSGSALIAAGIYYAIIGLILLAQPHYTYAIERARVNFWLQQEVLEAAPEPGETGSLYEQLILVVQSQGKVLYHGAMSEMIGPINLSTLTGPVFTGQTIEVTFTVHLPGPTTGNEFQGSHLATRFTLLTELIDPDEAITSFDFDIQPKESLFDLRNLNPGDSYSGILTITLDDTPPTVGGFSHAFFTFLGIFMVMAGLLLKIFFGRDEDEREGKKKRE